MFGLDARISLAIFGALSVISGAALYSAIQESKITAVLIELEELGKATTQYLLDTGSYVKMDPGEECAYLMSSLLVADTVSGWKGPYVSYSVKQFTNDKLVHPVYGDLLIGALKISSWDDVTNEDDNGPRCEMTDSQCAIFSCLDGLSDDMHKALDIKIDGSIVDASNGRIRYKSGSYLCLNVMPYPSNLSQRLN